VRRFINNKALTIAVVSLRHALHLKKNSQQFLSKFLNAGRAKVPVSLPLKYSID
jgi:hypothetical protein